jgi:hypothetical protein
MVIRNFDSGVIEGGIIRSTHSAAHFCLRVITLTIRKKVFGKL